MIFEWLNQNNKTLCFIHPNFYQQEKEFKVETNLIGDKYDSDLWIQQTFICKCLLKCLHC